MEEKLRIHAVWMLLSWRFLIPLPDQCFPEDIPQHGKVYRADLEVEASRQDRSQVSGGPGSFGQQCTDNSLFACVLHPEVVSVHWWHRSRAYRKNWTDKLETKLGTGRISADKIVDTSGFLVLFSASVPETASEACSIILLDRLLLVLKRC